MSIKKSDIAEAVANADETTFAIGEQVFVRCVTYHLTGRIVRISNIGLTYFLHLADAAWIANTERFMNAIEEGKLSEVEPVTKEVRVNISTIVDCFHWDNPLPRKQK